MKGDSVTFNPIARLCGALCCLSACLGPFAPLPPEHASHSHCQAVAHYIASQYATLPNSTLPVQYQKSGSHSGSHSGFITIDEPSIYDVVFQHKGFDAVIETCRARHKR